MTTVLTLLPAACGGFLLAVLWMDLIFDAQVLPHRQSADQLPEPVLASIAGYYHRATTSSRPMSTLIAVVMVILLGALAVQAMTGPAPGWLIAVSVASGRRPPMYTCTAAGCDTPARQGRLCVWHHQLRNRNGPLDLLAAVLRGTASLPLAACRGRSEWDANTPDDVETAIHVCVNECPELAACRQWVRSLPRGRGRPRITGLVVAGRHYQPRPTKEGPCSTTTQ